MAAMTGRDDVVVDDSDGPSTTEAFPVVGLGASAGGLEAMSAFFDHLPEDPGIALIVAPHQHPGFASMLPELIGRRTRLPVVEAADGMKVEVNRVYVSPPGDRIGVVRGAIRLFPRDTPSSDSPIDFFFRSLAADLGKRAVAVILSGTGSDGTAGAKAIKSVGGLVLAQSPSSAEHDSMPASVIAAGVADWVLPPEAMPDYLVSDRVPAVADFDARGAVCSPAVLDRILALLRSGAGHDLSGYKAPTLRRRVDRRIALHQLKSGEDYLAYLERQPAELDLLLWDLLIGVTSFFREPEVWQELADEALAPMFESRATEEPLRMWVPGCSTGEEVYTLTMVIAEVRDRLGAAVPLQIFGTDLNASAIETARAGVYPASIAADVGAERLERFFTQREDGFQVRPEIREQVVFAPHDLCRDPPFTRLDLLSCRNVLIYMEPALQERLLATFQFALRPGGVLLLGTSESVGRATDMFECINAPARIFRRVGHARPVRALGLPGGARARADELARAGTGNRAPSISDTVSRRLAARFVPPSIVVNRHGDIVHVHGRTGAFLEPAPGRPSHNAFAMARPGLGPALDSAVRGVLAGKGPVVHHGVHVRTNGDVMLATVTAEALTSGLALVSFEKEPAGPSPTDSERAAGPQGARVQQLEQQIMDSREDLQRTIEELEGRQEEYQSTNEELQSANEELETSKEEMHSLNEELQTVNAELRQKVLELSQSNDDMANLLDSTDVATLFLDRELRIRRFTSPARAVIHLIDTDVGRNIGDLTTALVDDTTAADAAVVLRTLVPRRALVRSVDGRSYLEQIKPYRTKDNVVDGVVINFVDTTELVSAEALAASRELTASIVDTVRDPLLVLDSELRVVHANTAFYRAFSYRPEQTSGVALYELGEGEWDIPELRRRLAQVLPSGRVMRDFTVEQDFPGVGRARLHVSAQRLLREAGTLSMILLSIRVDGTASHARERHQTRER